MAASLANRTLHLAAFPLRSISADEPQVKQPVLKSLIEVFYAE